MNTKGRDYLGPQACLFLRLLTVRATITLFNWFVNKHISLFLRLLCSLQINYKDEIYNHSSEQQNRKQTRQRGNKHNFSTTLLKITACG